MRAVIVLSVSSLKGGVGKTSVTLGLASAALARGVPTLVVDLDPQADATTGLDVAALSDRVSLREKIAAVLPLPAFLKRRWFGGGGDDGGAITRWSSAAGQYAEPMSGWVKAAAVAAEPSGARPLRRSGRREPSQHGTASWTHCR